MKLYLEMELLSDTCFAGSGGGRVGTVDTELEIDPQTRLPIVRGRTLKGLLLEELAQILRVLEKHDNGPWHEVATRLFGAPFQADRGSLTFGNGRLPDDLQAAVQCNRHQPRERQYWTQAEVLAALTTVRHQTKIDSESGAPEAHSLRSARLLRAGLRLCAPVDAHRPLDSAEQALLAACAVAVNRAGLHRNHGWGEVLLRVLDEQKKR
ncbi:MAG: RAMP superfamily protein [Candidatus Competibacteraceae bacterium]|nr:RAMP superfamily protein [Candidatus Competibacteraceae bacterium]